MFGPLHSVQYFDLEAWNFEAPLLHKRGGFAIDPDADLGADVFLASFDPSPPIKGGGDPSPSVPSVGVSFFLPPVVLRVLPLQGSSAPVGFIYDATPDPIDGGLLAAASSFFSH